MARYISYRMLNAITVYHWCDSSDCLSRILSPCKSGSRVGQDRAQREEEIRKELRFRQCRRQHHLLLAPGPEKAIFILESMVEDTVTSTPDSRKELKLQPQHQHPLVGSWPWEGIFLFWSACCHSSISITIAMFSRLNPITWTNWKSRKTSPRLLNIVIFLCSKNIDQIQILVLKSDRGVPGTSDQHGIWYHADGSLKNPKLRQLQNLLYLIDTNDSVLWLRCTYPFERVKALPIQAYLPLPNHLTADWASIDFTPLVAAHGWHQNQLPPYPSVFFKAFLFQLIQLFMSCSKGMRNNCVQEKMKIGFGRSNEMVIRFGQPPRTEGIGS